MCTMRTSHRSFIIMYVIYRYLYCENCSHRSFIIMQVIYRHVYCEN